MTSKEAATKVYRIVTQVPKGKVTTYGEIARTVGLKTPRQVGWLLHRNEDPEHVPCHRVVFADGSLSGNYAFGGREAQKKWLLSEGVPFKGDKVDLRQALYDNIS